MTLNIIFERPPIDYWAGERKKEIWYNSKVSWNITQFSFHGKIHLFSCDGPRYCRVKNSFSHLLVLCDPVFERSTNNYRKIVRHLLKIALKFYLRIGTFRSLFVYLVKKELSCVSNLELGNFLFCGRDLPTLRLPSINCNL